MNPLAWCFVALQISGSLRVINVVHAYLLRSDRHERATVNASTRPTVVVALAKKPRIRASATCAPCDHHRYDEKEGDPERSPSSLLLTQPSSAGASGSSVLVDLSKKRNW